MSDYVYSNNDGVVQNNVNGGSVFMQRSEVWWADDPFVLARPDLFSVTPPIVHSTTGRAQPEVTPVGLGQEQQGQPKRRAPYYERARRA